MISIIVPVYNIEKYLEKCVTSILNQTYKDFELILVNDGSNDSSGELCDKFKKIDARVRVIHKENGGLSDARNKGILEANGEYIAFVDGDDYIAYENAYEEMYNIAKHDNSDMVAGASIWYYSENNKKSFKFDDIMQKSSPMSSESYFLRCMQDNIVYAPVCFNLYRKSCILNNNLLFKKGIYHEDEEFTPRLLSNINTVSIYNKEFYVYRQREGSITNSNLNPKRGYDLLESFVTLETTITKLKNPTLIFEFRKYIGNLAIEQIYKYKFTKLPCEIKQMIKNNAVTKQIKVRFLLISISECLYIKIEEYYRKLRGINE